MKFSNRKVGTRSLKVTVERIRVKEIVQDPRFQCRDEKSAVTRAKKIYDACRLAGSDHYADPPILFRQGRKLFVVSGFGRVMAAQPDFLNWEEIECHVLAGPNDNEKDAQYVVFADNFRHGVWENALSKPEKQRAVYLLVTGDDDMTLAKAARFLNLTATTAAKYFEKGQELVTGVRKSPTDQKVMTQAQALSLIRKLFVKFENIKFKDLEDLKDYCRERYGVEFRIYSNDSVMLQTIAYQAATSEFKRFVTLCYKANAKKDFGATEMGEYRHPDGAIAKLLPDHQFLFLEMTDTLELFETRTFLRFLQDAEAAKLASAA